MPTTLSEAQQEIRAVDVAPEEAQQIIADPYRYAKSKGLDAEGKPLEVTIRYVPASESSVAEKKLKIKWTIQVNIKISNE